MNGKFSARFTLTTWQWKNAGLQTPTARTKLIAPSYHGNLPLEESTIAEIFQESGYFKQHIRQMAFRRMPPLILKAQGFDVNI